MFDIGWSELVVIGVVALIAIGPKELPGTLRMVGQWIGKAKRLAADFQGQFQEAMREAEVAEMKQQFDDLAKTADNLNATKMLGDLNKNVEDALKLDPASPSAPVVETTGEAQPDPNAPDPTAAVPVASEPLAIEPPPSVAPDASGKPS
jgi:sec-independent protein translocase protein TatB